jgi:hypothetical protein
LKLRRLHKIKDKLFRVYAVKAYRECRSTAAIISIFITIAPLCFCYVIIIAYRALVGKPEGRRPLGRPRRRWEDNIKMDLREVGWGCMDWMNLA